MRISDARATVALVGDLSRTSDGSYRPRRSGKRLSAPHHVRHSPLRCWIIRRSGMILFPIVILPSHGPRASARSKGASRPPRGGHPAVAIVRGALAKGIPDRHVP